MTLSSSVRKAVVLALGLLLAAAAFLAVARDRPAHAATADAAKTKTLRLSAASNKIAFNKKTLRVTHGKVTIVMKNPSGFPHAIAVEGHGIDKDGKTVNKGGTSRVTVTLKKGTYEFYCPVDGHKKAGMKGKLVVR